MARLKGAEDLPMYFGTSVEIMKRAIRLRKDQTEAEKIIWQSLRRRQIEGLKFRRQHPINNFVADFYCHEAKLVIEIDGGVHDDPEQKEKDLARQQIINDFGIKVLRFKNEEIFNDIESVIIKIKSSIH
ncbi:MAG TPA: endonuclease domain-containing protein [Bacteroidales bacterium]|nr:endonuclease domain-containing protein [Bacteroidales bacterium]